MAISPWLPWRRDRGGTGSRFAVDSWSPFFCPLPFPLSVFLCDQTKPHLLEHSYKSAICVHLRRCVTQPNWIAHKTPSIWPEVLTYRRVRVSWRCPRMQIEWWRMSFVFISGEMSIHHKCISHKCSLHKCASYFYTLCELILQEIEHNLSSMLLKVISFCIKL